MLYGMISSVGVRIIVNERLNFGNSRNLMIAAIILVLGIGCDSIPITGTVSISGLALSACSGNRYGTDPAGERRFCSEGLISGIKRKADNNSLL